MSALRLYLSNIAALIGQSTIQRLLGMLTTVLLARVLGVAGLGAYSAVINTASGAYGMVRLGVDAAIHVHTAEADQGENSRQDKGDMLGAGLLFLLGSGVVGATACLLLSNWLAKTVYGQPELARWMVFASGLVLLQCGSQFCIVTLAGLQQFMAYSRIMILSAVFSTLAVPIGAYSLGISGALLGMLGVQVVTVLLLARSTRGVLHKDGILMHLGSFKQWMRRHLQFGFPFYAAGLLSVPVAWYLQGMLSRHAGLNALGQLRVITAILALISFIPTAASSAMVSLLTRSSTRDYPSFIQQSLLHIKYVWLFAVFSGLGVFLGLPLIVGLLFGKAYMGAIAPASYAILTAIISCVLGFVGNILFARRRVGLILAQTACQVAVFVGIATISIPQMGLSGYLAAEFCGYIASLIFVYITAASWRERRGISFPWMVPMMVLSVIDGIGVLLISLPATEKFRVTGALLLIAITALASGRYILTKEECAVLRSNLTRAFMWMSGGKC